ncbi:MAG: hypothetical protein H7331_11900 [Bacteroidia bacterium]|nr:hypothetical protein [Bacteroidia bacterium]
MKEEFLLNNVDAEDLEDLLLKVEDSFGIKFVDNDLISISTFGQLCDLVTNKIQLEDTDTCTSQQVFYKLRKEINSLSPLSENKIFLGTPLLYVFPRKNRRLNVKLIENKLGFKLNILRPPHWAIVFFVITLLLSFIYLFISIKIGFLGVSFSMVGLWFLNKIGNELDLKTVRELVEKTTQENYVKSRRDSKSVNKKEIEQILTNWFSRVLFLDKSVLTKESKF